MPKQKPSVSDYIDLLASLDTVKELAALQRLFREEVGESDEFDRALAAHVAKLPGVIVIEPGVRLSEEEIRRRLYEAEIRDPRCEAQFWQEWFEVDPVPALEALRRDEKRAFNQKKSDGGRMRAEALHGPVDPKRDAAIRKAYAAGAKQKDLAQKYNVSKARISQICNPKVK